MSNTGYSPRLVDEDRRALVTGSTGFIGPALVSGLLDQGWDVHVLIRPTTSVKRLADTGSLDRVTVHVDSVNFAELAAAVAQARPDVCFHLATYFVGVHSAKDIEPLVSSNIGFGTRLIQALADAGNCLLINTATAWQHFESHAYSPTSLYASTKQAFADIAQYYAEAGLVRTLNLALFDTYGPHDPRVKLLPLLIKSVSTSEMLQMSPGDQLIDLTYIDDVVAAFINAVDVAANSEEQTLNYAVSSGSAISIRSLVSLVEEVTGKKVPVEWGAKPYRAREMMTPWNAGTVLPGWAPKVNLAEGIRRVWLSGKEI